MVTGSIQKRTYEKCRKQFAEWSEKYGLLLVIICKWNVFWRSLAHLYFDKGLAPSTIGNYLSGYDTVSKLDPLVMKGVSHNYKAVLERCTIR